MALQASPRQQTAIPPDAFSLDAPPARHHYGVPTSPRVDERPTTSPRSPGSSRHRSNGQQTTPMQTHRSPVLGSASTGSTARPVTIQVASRVPDTSNSYQRDANGAQPADGPVVAPPRTSSHQRAVTTSGPTDFHLPDRTRTRSRSDAEDAPSNGQAPRTPRDLPASPPLPSASGARDQRQAAGRARNDPPVRPAEMSRDNSEVLDRLIVTDPQVDLTREKERLAESIPARDAARATSLPREAEPRATPRSRQDFSNSASKRKETRFGDYVLGQTLGEGEFGKVKLGWKKDGSVEVAIKLIRRENLNTNPSRLPKIYREISILQGLSHPNIVRLHEMVQTERHIGIILEYASGGELFDYILTHRYLKDNAARRLFAQLVSGVGYLHKKGIVHRDLKLENLLLDRNRNIIITDFGFANTFDPRDELGEEIEFNLTNRDFVKRMGLEHVENGHRRGDLMQTSCGSPCYAAPELVVTDSLYTGRKVDVWSCGVILYAMLAGYLPFDDDPANPEGDNINLLYKYIVSTPLTFPEYVSPHARDLLRRILVPDPRKRADLFEVARHSWLAEYAHVVAHVTSMTTSLTDLANTNYVQDFGEPPSLARSASVREPTKPHSAGGLNNQHKLDESEARGNRDSKRRTVQVEYVAPQSQTARGEMSPPSTPSAHAAIRAAEAALPKASSHANDASRHNTYSSSTTRKPLPQSPADERSTKRESRRHPPVSPMEASPRSGREPPRVVSDSAQAFGQLPATSSARPATGGSMSSTGAGRLPSRGNSYGQPVAPTVAATTAQGSLAQPKGSRNYNISAPVPQQEPYIPDHIGSRPVSQRVSTNRYSAHVTAQGDNKGHKRSNTFGNVFGRTGSLFTGRSRPQSPVEKRHPPTSMKAPMAGEEPRPSTDVRRPSTDVRRPSLGFSRKSSDVSKPEKEQKTRRFSLLPTSFTLKGMTGSKPSTTAPSPSASDARPTTQPGHYGYPSAPAMSEAVRPDGPREHTRHVSAPLARPTRATAATANASDEAYPPSWRPGDPGTAYPYGEPAPTESNASFAAEGSYAAAGPGPQRQGTQSKPRYPPGFNETDAEPAPRPSMQSGRAARVLHKPNRRFNEAWERDHEAGHNASSSGAARRVMDFFRRRGKARTGEDR